MATDIEGYQILVERLLGKRPPSLWTYQPECGTAACFTHAVAVPPIRADYPSGECAYCGSTADTVDHILPRNWTGRAARNRVVTVPACRECNSAIGDRYAPTVQERRSIAHSFLRRKYKAALRTVMYGPSDLAELGPNLRAFKAKMMATHEWVMARLEWPPDRFYDDRAMASAY